MLNFLQSLRAVMWSFLGIRKGRDRERDFAQLKPLPVLVAALLCLALFIGVLVGIVKMVTR